jgi:septation ring formation regulator EzrA
MKPSEINKLKTGVQRLVQEHDAVMREYDAHVQELEKSQALRYLDKERHAAYLKYMRIQRAFNEADEQLKAAESAYYKALENLTQGSSQAKKINQKRRDIYVELARISDEITQFNEKCEQDGVPSLP